VRHSLKGNVANKCKTMRTSNKTNESRALDKLYNLKQRGLLNAKRYPVIPKASIESSHSKKTEYAHIHIIGKWADVTEEEPFY
jgi:hypothetical protein